jgi:hypothetical protein
MRCDLEDDEAVVSTAASLNLDVDLVVGKLHRLWVWFGKNTTTGRVKHVDCAWINSFLRCELFCESLKKVGWLVEDENGILLPRFTRHNGQNAKQRALTARRVAKHRGQKCNGPPVTKTLPEKRRVEKSREDKNGKSTSQGDIPAPKLPQPHVAVAEYFRDKWKIRWKCDVFKLVGEDYSTFFRLLKEVSGDAGRMQGLIDDYLAGGDDWIRSHKHPIRSFSSEFNKLAAARSAPVAEFVEDN